MTKCHCGKIAIYNFAGLKARYCKTHSQEDMANVKNKRCIEMNCNKQPSYNFKGETQALYCVTHSLEEMVDIKSKHCIEDDCNKQPNYNFKDQKKALYCKTHALKEMVDIRSKRCIEDECDKIPNYNFKGETQALYCKTHALKEMINIKSKRCELCQMTLASKNGYCSPCFYYTFPEHVKTRQHKTKENTFMFQLKNLYPEIILDKTVAGGCSRRRPDGLLDFLSHSVIVEIDEDQHESYDSTCELARLNELYTDLGDRPIIFIRVNPDSYTRNGKRVSGCFGRDMKLNEREFGKRFEMLLECLEKSKAPPLSHVSEVKICFSD